MIFAEQFARKQVAEIQENEICDDIKSDVGSDISVNALQGPVYSSQCWNCDSKGHHWQDCLQDRQARRRCISRIA